MSALAEIYLTTGEIAARLGVGCWSVRRAVDKLHLPVQRAGLYRLIPARYIAEIEHHIRGAKVEGDDHA